MWGARVTMAAEVTVGVVVSVVVINPEATVAAAAVATIAVVEVVMEVIIDQVSTIAEIIKLGLIMKSTRPVSSDQVQR